MAFEDWYKDHADGIRRLCAVLVHERGLADDLFQEVLSNIWKGLPKFKGNADLQTWAYRIAVNTSIRFNAGLKRQANIKAAAKEIPATPEERNPNAERLIRAIQYLNDAERGLIGLFLEGFSYKEISDVLGISPSNVGARLNRTKSKISLIIKEKNL